MTLILNQIFTQSKSGIVTIQVPADTEALKNSDNVLYKEWCLIFATLERPLLSNINAVSLANDVINEKPQSTIANTILMLF